MKTEQLPTVPLLARVSVKLPAPKNAGPGDGQPPSTRYTMTARETTDDE